MESAQPNELQKYREMLQRNGFVPTGERSGGSHFTVDGSDCGEDLGWKRGEARLNYREFQYGEGPCSEFRFGEGLRRASFEICLLIEDIPVLSIWSPTRGEPWSFERRFRFPEEIARRFSEAWPVFFVNGQWAGKFPIEGIPLEQLASPDSEAAFDLVSRFVEWLVADPLVAAAS